MTDLILFALLVPGSVFLLFAAYGMWRAFHESKTIEQRQENNECLTCGYNLTANTSGKCPECGKPIN